MRLVAQVKSVGCSCVKNKKKRTLERSSSPAYFLTTAPGQLLSKVTVTVGLSVSESHRTCPPLISPLWFQML